VVVVKTDARETSTYRRPRGESQEHKDTWCVDVNVSVVRTACSSVDQEGLPHRDQHAAKSTWTAPT